MPQSQALAMIIMEAPQQPQETGSAPAEEAIKPKATENVQGEGKPEEDVSSEVVFNVSSNDCLMGRGAAVIGNEGNRRFRKLIQKYKAEYDATRIRQEKDRIARRIVDTITSRGGRFLRKIDTPQQAEFFKVPAGKSAWVIVNQLVVLQKVKQAFRDDRRTMEEVPSSESKDAGGTQESGSPSHSQAASNQQNAFAMDPLLGYRTMINPSLLLSTGLGGLSPLSNPGLLHLHEQALLGPQLNPSLAQILAMRQMDSIVALRRQALLEQAILEENRRALLLRQALAQPNAAAADPAATLASLHDKLAASAPSPESKTSDK